MIKFAMLKSDILSDDKSTGQLSTTLANDLAVSPLVHG